MAAAVHPTSVRLDPATLRHHQPQQLKKAGEQEQ